MVKILRPFLGLAVVIALTFLCLTGAAANSGLESKLSTKCLITIDESPPATSAAMDTADYTINSGHALGGHDAVTGGDLAKTANLHALDVTAANSRRAPNATASTHGLTTNTYYYAPDFDHGGGIRRIGNGDDGHTPTLTGAHF